MAELLDIARGTADVHVEELTQDVAKRDLARLGLKLDENDDLLVQNQSPQLERALQGTPFVPDWRQYLARPKGADEYRNRPITCHMRVSKCVRVPSSGERRTKR